MPAFVDGLSPEQRWAITDYIVSLPGSDGPGYANLVVAKPVRDVIDLAKGAAIFSAAPVARLPIIGQIMEPGRAFSPSATSVTVQAIYDAESMAVLVRWHDRTAEKAGQNGPSLQVPPEEEEAATGGAKPAGDNPFGDAEVGAWRGPAGRTGPLCRCGANSRPRLRVLRRRLDPDSLGSADRRAQALLHLRRQPERGRPLVLRSRAGRARFCSPARAAPTSRRATRRGSPVSPATTRANGRSSSSGRVAPRPVPRSTPGSSRPSPSRSGTGSRASAGTGADSRCGIRSTSNPKTYPRRSSR